MWRFNYFEHTADIGIRGYGETFLEALEGVSRGMFKQICDCSEMSVSMEKQVEVSGETNQDLVIRFLNKLIVLLETEQFVPLNYQLSQPNANIIQSVLKGDELDSSRHVVYAEVKAVTYHHFEIKQNGEWMIQVVVDV